MYKSDRALSISTIYWMQLRANNCMRLTNIEHECSKLPQSRGQAFVQTKTLTTRSWFRRAKGERNSPGLPKEPSTLSLARVAEDAGTGAGLLAAGEPAVVIFFVTAPPFNEPDG